jgi:competence protein ComFC
VSPFYFENSIAKGLIRFKNHGFTELAPAYAKDIAACVNNHFEGVKFDCITFVPLRKLKKLKRGYNQTEILANELGKVLNLPVENLLIKTRYTKSQRTMSARERRTNLRGAFDLALDKEIDGKYILLVDDIKTTGSTLNECAYTLFAYGAKEVYAVSAAVVKYDPTKHKSKNHTK